MQFNASPADIGWWDFQQGIGLIVMPATAPAGQPHLGLQFDDDIDALVYLQLPMANFPDYRWVFSLAPGSPSLAGGFWSPADIMLSDGWGHIIVFLANNFGLDAAEDDIDALDTFSYDWGDGSAYFDGSSPSTSASFDNLWGMELQNAQAFSNTIPEPGTCFALVIGFIVAAGPVLRLRLKK